MTPPVARRVRYLVGSDRAGLEAALVEYRSKAFVSELGVPTGLADDIEAHLAWMDQEREAGR